MKINRYHILLLAFIFTISCRKSDFLADTGDIVLTDSGEGTGTVTWTKDKHYVLKGLVFVNDGQTLTIEPGTVIRFSQGQAENSSALIVARGGKIIAEGTRQEPIIFTSEDDDLEGSVSYDERGLWGGIIILGNAPLNITGGESSIEGVPLYEPRIVYGGFDENDNSGSLKYVSIRHGGTNIGDGNEINGLTLGGVGSSTTIDYVEVISNADDGIEIFGGNVNLSHLMVANCGDDAFDYDLGWSGNGQFWLGIQASYLGDKLIEAGGGTDPVNGQPYSLPQIFNTTLYGNGNSNNSPMISFENNAGGILANSVMVNNKQGIYIQQTDNIHDSFHQWETGNLGIQNNIFFNVCNNIDSKIFAVYGVATDEQKAAWSAYFQEAKNRVSDPGLANYINNFVPSVKLTGDIAPYPNSWFQQVDFKGAFGEDNWLEEWSILNTLE